MTRLDLRFRGSRQPAQAARMRPPGQTSRKGGGLGANKRRAGPGGWRRAPLARARPSPHGRLIFQSIIRFGVTGWVGDPAIGSPDLPSPPVDGPQPLVQPGRPLRGSPLCSGKRLWPVETSCSYCVYLNYLWQSPAGFQADLSGLETAPSK